MKHQCIILAAQRLAIFYRPRRHIAWPREKILPTKLPVGESVISRTSVCQRYSEYESGKGTAPFNLIIHEMRKF